MKIQKIMFILVAVLAAVLFLGFPANAESGTITLDDIATKSGYNFGSGGAADYGDAVSVKYIRVANTQYNKILTATIYIQTAGRVSFTKTYNSDTFTITSGGSGTGSLAYNATDRRIYYYFNDDVVFTGAALILTFTNNINTEISFDQGYAGSSNVDVNKPFCVGSNDGQCFGADSNTGGAVVLYNSNTAVTTSISYANTYPVYSGIQYFNMVITKLDSITNRAAVEGVSSIYCNPPYDTISYACLAPYADGLYINLSLSGGANTKQVVNSSISGIIPPDTPQDNINPDTGVGIIFNSDSYSIGDTANISWVRTEAVPLFCTDYVRLTTPASKYNLVVSPGNSGYMKTVLNIIGTYETSFERDCFIGGTTVLDTDSATVSSGEQPSYILASSPQGAGIAFNITYSFGYTPKNQGELNSIVIEKLVGDVWVQSNAISLNNTEIVQGTEYNISLALGDIGKYRLRLFELSRGYVAFVIIDSIAVDIPVQKNITTSIIEVDKAEYLKSDELIIYYAIDNTNYSNYYSKYISIIHASGTYPETSHILITEQEDTINYASGSGHIQRAKQGLNYVQLRAKNNTADILLTNTSFNISFIDSAGYGLDVLDSEVCKGEKITIKYSTPTTSTLRINTAPDNTVPILYYEVSINGSGSISLKLSQAGDYQILIYEGAVGNIKKFTTATASSSGTCIIPEPTPTYKNINGTWNPTQDNIKDTCSFWDNWVRTIFGSQGVNDVTRLQFALFLVGAIMFLGMIASRGNFGVAVALGFLPYAFFAYLSLSSPCGQYMPLWVTVFIALIVCIKMKWF